MESISLCVELGPCGPPGREGGMFVDEDTTRRNGIALDMSLPINNLYK